MHAVGHSLAEIAWEEDVVAGIVTNAVLAVLVGAMVGLMEVTLAHELIARDRRSKAA